MHFPKLCWRKSAQCFQESSLVLFLLITSFIRKRKQILFLESFYPLALTPFYPFSSSTVNFFNPIWTNYPLTLTAFTPIGSAALTYFYPSQQISHTLTPFYPPPPPGSPTPISFYPFWTNYALTLTPFCLFPPIVAYCCPLFPGKVSQRGWFFKSPPIAAHFYMEILVRG